MAVTPGEILINLPPVSLRIRYECAAGRARRAFIVFHQRIRTRGSKLKEA